METDTRASMRKECRTGRASTGGLTGSPTKAVSSKVTDREEAHFYLNTASFSEATSSRSTQTDSDKSTTATASSTRVKSGKESETGKVPSGTSLSGRCSTGSGRTMSLQLTRKAEYYSYYYLDPNDN
jgi:hypothetical protein